MSGHRFSQVVSAIAMMRRGRPWRVVMQWAKAVDDEDMRALIRAIPGALPRRLSEEP